jgi:membrane protein
MGEAETDADLSTRPDMQEPGAVEAMAGAAIERLPVRVRGVVVWLLARWPGRIAFRSAAACVRIEIFDRSMTIAAQFFTSVFPILILIATLFGSVDTRTMAEVVNMPEESRSLLDQALQNTGASTFGVVGVLIVFASATSLSRALTRAYAAIWLLPRPRSSLRSAWRWLAVVVSLALSLVVVRALSGFMAGVPPGGVWQRVVAFAIDVAMTLLVPWLLLSGVIPVRRLLPTSLLFAMLMLVVRPASELWLPRALEVSADRYGSIGVAFTYLAWLYVVAFTLLLSAVVGRAVAMDEGWLGRWFRGATG